MPGAAKLMNVENDRGDIGSKCFFVQERGVDRRGACRGACESLGYIADLGKHEAKFPFKSKLIGPRSVMFRRAANLSFPCARCVKEGEIFAAFMV